MAQYCDCGKFSENQTEGGDCASCAHAKRKAIRLGQDASKRILKPMGDKQKKALSDYSKKKALWIQGRPCAVYPNLKATQVHHKMGRIGYADEWARQRGITLLLDERFWLPVSMKGHNRVELNPKWAREHGYSLPRTEILS